MINRKIGSVTLITYGVAAVVITMLILTGMWSLVGIPAGSVKFLDMAGVLSAMECHNLGVNVIVSNPCDPLNRSHIYGLPLLWLGDIGVSREHTMILGLLVIFLFYFSIIYLVRPSTPLQACALLILALSPAVLLGVERGNYDLLVCVLCIYATINLSRSTTSGYVFGMILLLFCTLTKFYPGSVLGALLLFYGLRHQLVPASAALLAIALVMVYGVFKWEELSGIFSGIPRSTGSFTFGGETLFSRIGVELTPLTYWSSLLAGILVTVISFYVAKNFCFSLRNTSPLSKLAFLVGGTQLMFCFFTSISYDYRAVFALMMLPLWFELLVSAKSRFNRGLLYFLFVSFAYTLWAEFFVHISAGVFPHLWFRLSEILIMWTLSVPITSILWALLLPESDAEVARQRYSGPTLD